MGSHAGAGRRVPQSTLLVATAVIVASAMIASGRSPDAASPVVGSHHVGAKTPKPDGDRRAERPVSAGAQGRATGSEPRAARTRPVHARWGRMLRVLDRRRARAFAKGEPRLLGGVYLEGSPARAADTETIEAYADRGLRITGLRMRILSLTGTSRGLGDIRLVVVDRIARAAALDRRHRRVLLPRDRATSHQLIVEHTARGWRIASIT